MSTQNYKNTQEGLSMAAYIAASTHLVAIAERPSPISARDGMLLRLVPKSERLSHQQLKAALLQASGIGVQDAPAFTAVGMEVPAQQLGFLDASNGTDSCSFGYDPVPAHAHSIPCTPLLVGDSDEGHIQPLSLPHGVLENEHADVALQMAVLGMTHGPEVTHKGAGKVIAPKAGAAWLRGYAYLAQGNITQALQDAKTCLAYAPALHKEGAHTAEPGGLNTKGKNTTAVVVTPAASCPAKAISMSSSEMIKTIEDKAVKILCEIRSPAAHLLLAEAVLCAGQASSAAEQAVLTLMGLQELGADVAEAVSTAAGRAQAVGAVAGVTQMDAQQVLHGSQQKPQKQSRSGACLLSLLQLLLPQQGDQHGAGALAAGKDHGYDTDASFDIGCVSSDEEECSDSSDAKGEGKDGQDSGHGSKLLLANAMQQLLAFAAGASDSASSLLCLESGQGQIIYGSALATTGSTKTALLADLARNSENMHSRACPTATSAEHVTDVTACCPPANLCCASEHLLLQSGAKLGQGKPLSALATSAAGSSQAGGILSRLQVAVKALAAVHSTSHQTPELSSITLGAAWTLLLQAQARHAARLLQSSGHLLPAAHARALRRGGVAGLREHLAQEQEKKAPEIHKSRPTYYHYRQWMRRRLRHACPGLPAAVEEKLLATDADDLDLLLQHPLGVQAQALEYVSLLARHGSDALIKYDANPLAWEEVQALAGPGTIGLTLGYNAQATAAERRALNAATRAALPAPTDHSHAALAAPLSYEVKSISTAASTSRGTATGGDSSIRYGDSASAMVGMATDAASDAAHAWAPGVHADSASSLPLRPVSCAQLLLEAVRGLTGSSSSSSSGSSSGGLLLPSAGSQPMPVAGAAAGCDSKGSLHAAEVAAGHALLGHGEAVHDVRRDMKVWSRKELVMAAAALLTRH